MKKIICLIGSMLIAFFMTSCLENIGGGSGGGNLPSEGTDKTFNKLFDISNKVKISLNIASEELYKIQQDYEKYSKANSKSPIYRYCRSVDIYINDEMTTVEHVGIRMKGNTSRKDFFTSDFKFTSLVHFKLSFDETFDNKKDINGDDYYDKELLTAKEKEVVGKRTVLGVQSVELRWNKNYDKTFVREVYAARLFKYYGVASSEIGLCNLTLNNQESLGVFTLSEVIDKDFLKRSFGNSDFDLYKCSWRANFTTSTINSIGVEDENKGYFPIYDLKTNKKTSQHKDLKRFINDFDISLDNEKIINYLDEDYFISFMAVYFLLGDPDNIFYNSNNYYIYFFNHKAYFIPYDYDRGLGVKKDYNPSGNALINANPIDKKDINNNRISNPLFIQTILNSSSKLQQKYLNKIKAIKNDSYFTMQKYQSFYDIAYSNYHELVKPSLKELQGYYTDFNVSESKSTSGDKDNYSIALYFENKYKN